MNEKKSDSINSLGNILVGAIAGLLAFGCFFIALKRPWVEPFYETVHPNTIHKTYSPKNTKLTHTMKQRVNRYVSLLYQATDPHSPNYKIDLECMRNISGFKKEYFQLSVDYLKNSHSNYSHYDKWFNYDGAVEDILNRVDMAFSDPLLFFSIDGRSKYDNNLLAFTALEGRIAIVSSTMSEYKFSSSINKCLKLKS